jgi:hypothetical protein
MVNKPNMVAIKPAKLTKAALLAIARIVRISADLEDILDLWMCKLAGTTQAQTQVLLGRSNISTKLAIADGLANLSGGDNLLLHNTVFDDNITRLLSCRNAVAHGVLVGKDPQGRFIFSTNTQLGYEGDELAKRAVAYGTDLLVSIADTAEMRVKVIDDLLELGPLRSKRKRQHLEELPEGQRRRQSASRRKRRRGPSPK